MTFHAIGDTGYGRNFMFAGKSSLITDAEEECVTTTTTTTKPCRPGSPDLVLVDWKMCNATVHGNLGGLGPDKGAAEIRFSNVATTSDGSIDLVVTNLTHYGAYKSERNRENNCFGVINIAAPSDVELSFRFVKSGTHDSVALPRSLFTVYDIDESKEGIREAVSFNTAVSSYWLLPTSELVAGGTNEGELTIHSTTVGIGEDNPTDPVSLTLEQGNRAVTVGFDGVDEYIMTFHAIGDTGYGRNFMFAGKSSLITDAEEECVTTTTTTTKPCRPGSPDLVLVDWKMCNATVH